LKVVVNIIYGHVGQTLM